MDMMVVSYGSNFKNKLEKKTVVQLTLVGNLVL